MGKNREGTSKILVRLGGGMEKDMRSLGATCVAGDKAVISRGLLVSH